jgi:hypothetical protein
MLVFPLLVTVNWGSTLETCPFYLCYHQFLDSCSIFSFFYYNWANIDVKSIVPISFLALVVYATKYATNYAANPLFGDANMYIKRSIVILWSYNMHHLFPFTISMVISNLNYVYIEEFKSLAY